MKVGGQRPSVLAHDDSIQLGADAKSAATAEGDWGFLLLVFMRVVSGLWVYRGLLHWETILGGEQSPFEVMAPSIAACVIFFAVADLVAAVGLWLAVPWGGVVWLFAVLASILASLLTSGFSDGGRVMLVIDFILIAAYFVLSWYAAQTRED